jgi:hypothetical protein
VKNVIPIVKHAQDQLINAAVVKMDIICLIIYVYHVFLIVKHVQVQQANVFLVKMDIS